MICCKRFRRSRLRLSAGVASTLLRLDTSRLQWDGARKSMVGKQGKPVEHAFNEGCAPADAANFRLPPLSLPDVYR
jgi:hypothetical protein